MEEVTEKIEIDTPLQHKAVAYAVTHKDEVPDNVKKFIDDLYEYEEAGKRLQQALNEARKSAEKIEEQMNQLFGSIEAVVRIVARELGDEKVIEFGNKYNPSALKQEDPA